ncbi:putative kinesin [Mycena leptocephala]|nr:putative kinesin [Mycena leptocephala]
MQPLKSSSHSDWLSHCIHIAKILKEAADLIPVSYVKGAIGTVVILLETVEKVKQNRKDLRELCENTTRIVVYLGEQLASQQDTTGMKLKDMCEELERDLQGVIVAIGKLRGSRGLSGQVKEFFKARSITDKIAGYQRRIQAKCETLKLTSIVDIDFKVAEIQTAILDMQADVHDMRFQVDEIHAAVISSNFSSVQTSQSIRNCPPPSRNFLGRQIILDKMHQYFNQNLGKQHVHVLYGLGGAGKTQIALKFIEESSHFTDQVFVDASTTETIDISLKTIATTRKIGDSSQDALKWFAAKQEPWLLFFDNADDPKIDLNQFLPKCKHGNIVITSRNPGLRGYGQYSQVSDMDEMEAVELLLKSASQDTSSANKQIAAEIVKALSYFPLAIVQAGAFILESGALDTYLELYMKNRAQLLSERPAQTHDDYSWTVYTTWQMSFDKLTQPAAMFLQLCSFLHREGISEDIFSWAVTYSFPRCRPSKKELEKPMEFLSYLLTPTGKWNPLSFVKLTNEIKAFSLISFDPESKVFSIHPLVHAWGRTIIANPELYHSIMGAILGMAISEIPDQDKQLASLRLLPHVESVLQVNREFSPDFRSEYGLVYDWAGKYTEAKNLLIVVLDKSQQRLGESHRNTLQIMGDLAVTYRHLGEFKKEEELEVVVLEKRKLLLGDDHPHTLAAMSNLAGTYSKLRAFTQAEELEIVVLEKQKLQGHDHPDTLRAMGNLAATYHQLKEFKKAEELEVIVLEKQKQHLGDDHPDTLRAMGNLAATYRQLKECIKAEELEVVVLKKLKQLLGHDHPNTLRAMGNLAATYHQLTEFKKAEKLLVIVVEKQKQHFGDDHPDTLSAMGHLAATYRQLKEFKKAEELELSYWRNKNSIWVMIIHTPWLPWAEELQVVVLEKQKQLQGYDHPDTLNAMGILAATYHQLKEFKKAEELEAIVLEKQKQHLGDDHPDTLLAMGNLAATYYKLKEFKKAEELEVVVLEKRKQVLGDDHPHTLSTMGNLAATYRQLKEFKKAEELQVVVLEKQKKLLGYDHPDTLNAMGILAATYHQLKDFKKAEELEVIVLEKQKQHLGDDHPDTLRTMGNLAATYHQLTEFNKAEELEVIVLEKQKQHLGDDHPDTLLAMGNLAATYYKLKEFKKAEELEVVVLEKQKQHLGDDHPDTLFVMGNLALSHRQLKEFTKAEGLEVVVLEKRKQVQGYDHPHTMHAMGNLALTYKLLKEFAKAEELEAVVLEKRKHLLSDDHPDTLLAMENLAATYGQLKEFTKAEELELIVLAKRKQVLGDDHPDTLLAMGNLASTYHSLGKQTKADELEKFVKKQ